MNSLLRIITTFGMFFWIGHCTVKGHVCDWWSELSTSLCQCRFRSLVICDNLTTSTSLDKLFQTLRYRDVDLLDGLNLVGVDTNVFFGPYKETSVQIQTLELSDSNLSWVTPEWNDTWLDETTSLVLRRVVGLDTWNWVILAQAFDSLQYLEIDQSRLKVLPDDFASLFDHLVGLSIVRSQLRVIGQRSMHCGHCRSVNLKNNMIESLNNGTFVIMEGPSFHLDLRNNLLETLPEDLAHVSTPNIDFMRIDLNGNPLKRLTEVTFKTLRTVSSIYINFHAEDGFLVCDCAMSFLGQGPFEAEHLFCSLKTFNETDNIVNFLKSC